MDDPDPLEKYKKIYPIYQLFARELKELCENFLQRENIRFHFVEARAKTPKSLAEKVTRPGKNYQNPFKEITDLVGVRVIVHYQEDLQRVRNLIAKEFLVEEFSDKGELLTCNRGKSASFDRFGYLSYHFIVAIPEPDMMSEQWKPIDKWSEFKEFCAEIQVRTMLQHVWAAFSHSVAYKDPRALPKELQRDFYGLAALLEMADRRFSAIYREKQQLSESVPKNLLDQDIDQVTLEQYLRGKEFPVVLKEKATKLGFNVKESEITSNNLHSLFQVCRMSELNMINQLNAILQNISQETENSLICFLKKVKVKWTVDLAFLAELILIIQFSDKLTVEFLVTMQGWDKDIAYLVVECAKNCNDH